jgi:hypothetical protein
MKYRTHPLVFFYFFIVLSLTGQTVLAQDTQGTIDDWQEHDAVLVGRISHVEGNLSRFDPETDEWVSTTRESPFGTDDLLRTDVDARAEIILPNNTWARINGDTRIQLVTLTPQTTEVDLPSGNGRFYNKSTQTEVNVTTPFGRIAAPPGAAVDLYVDEEGIDIVAVQDSVYFYHNTSGKRHEVRSDSTALFADLQEVTAIADAGDPEWTAWNQKMDALWTDRLATRGQSATYLPPELYTEAYALDEYGHWERVYYQGRYYRFWRPVQISAGWSPFTWGAWVVWHGDQVWIPHEPFGYITCHYGNWIFTAGHWFWAPPVTLVMARARLPLLHIGFGWYPGRVSWIHSGAYVGWIPLAPFEPYYTHHHWGRRSIAAARWRGEPRPFVYQHRQHAVIIHRSHLYRTDDYRPARIRNISQETFRTRFRSTPVPDREVLKDNRHREKQDRFYQDRFNQDQERHNTGSSDKIRPANDHGRYTRHFGDKRRLDSERRPVASKEGGPTSAARRPVRKPRVEQAAGKASTMAQKNYRRHDKPRPRTARRYPKREISEPAGDVRQDHHIRDQRSAQRRESLPRNHERHQAEKEIGSRRSQPQVHHPEENRAVRDYSTNRPNRPPQFRTRGREPAAASPPVVRRQPPKVSPSPTSTSPGRQEQNHRQWQPSPDSRGNEREAFRQFRGGQRGAQHRHWQPKH